ncbi:polysaccharide pyruvyl transferase family protein [Psychromonas sp. PT13]|uniref:polysaccharide pyruvyl transferase family protein n=1 Tax=Psychromonas sp. PT13 TaxID=3439547 RepID=UPI003EBE8DDE
MEFGNIGNYYIMEPFFRELHNTFPNAQIKTTMQLSQRFCNVENVTVVPLELYYGWVDNELKMVKEELAISEKYKRSGSLIKSTPFIDEVVNSDLVIDFSGDIWGDNANFLGNNRFEIGLLKNKIAQNLGKKVVMLAGSPGPFGDDETKALALDVYKNFDLVTNREPISTDLLAQEGFEMANTKTLACPAFLFEPCDINEILTKIESDGLKLKNREKPIVGFIICGWNFEEGPFDKWPREDSDYVKFAEIIEYLTVELGLQVCIMSHSNGFDVPVTDFKLIHGRDYLVTKQLEEVVKKRGIAHDFFVLNKVYDAWQTKAIIGSFNMLVSGRVHAAVAALSQIVPTVIIDYGHEPKAHKLLGFASVVGVSEYVADPSLSKDLILKVTKCWSQRINYEKFLQGKIPEVKKIAKQNFELLKVYSNA